MREGHLPPPTETSPLLQSASAPPIGHSTAVDNEAMSSTDNTIAVLVELIGARHLPLIKLRRGAQVQQRMETYCVVQYGTKTIHQTTPHTPNLSSLSRFSRALWRMSSRRAATLHARSLQNPIWTIQEHSVFCFHVTVRDLANHKALVVNLWAKRRSRASASPTRSRTEQVQLIGRVRLKCTDVLGQHIYSEDRVELLLENELGQVVRQHAGGKEATLALRFRLASKADVKFCNHWNQIDPLVPFDSAKLLRDADILQNTDYLRGALVTEVEGSDIRGKHFISAVTGALHQQAVSLGGDNVIPVKPYPDPERPEETKRLTKQEITEMTQLPSQKWVQAFSDRASLGRIYVEILSAHDLPNVDVGSSLGNATDAFCVLCYGDVMLQTDVVDDELSPHWLPWTQRAFVLTMGHPSHMLYLAIFGFKRNPLLNHTPIGRVEVNLSNFQNKTVYNLEFNLFGASHTFERQVKGRLRIRLRKEISDERRALLSTLQVSPAAYINVSKKKSLLVARYTCCGEYDSEDQFRLQVLDSYIKELLDRYLKRLIESIKDGATSLMFWRGQVHGFPLYSLAALIIGIAVVEKPRLIPAAIFFGLAGLLLVQLQERLKSPSPWEHCLPFSHQLAILLKGKSLPRYTVIDANAGAEQIKKRDAELERRREEERLLDETREAIEKELQEMESQLHVQTKSTGLSLELLVALGKIQSIIGLIMRFLRRMDVILCWEESNVTFFVTVGLFLSGFVALFLPWALITKISGHILVVLLLGPQNKLIDLVWHRSDEESGERLQKLFRRRIEEARYKHEEGQKIKAFRQLLFGRYSTFNPGITWTPHRDIPLPCSTAHFSPPGYHESNEESLDHPFVVGQALCGKIILRPEEAHLRNETESHKLKDMAVVLQSKAEKVREMATNTVQRLDSGVLDEGFEVVDIFDEEAGFLRDLSKQPCEESLRELGVEIIRENEQSMLFTPAWQSSDEQLLDGQDVKVDEKKDQMPMKTSTTSTFKLDHDQSEPSLGKEGTDTTQEFLVNSGERILLRQTTPVADGFEVQALRMPKSS